MNEDIKPCCGNCIFFKYEDFAGIGLCELGDHVMHCDEFCENHKGEDK